MSRRVRNLLFGALSLAVVVVTFAVVLPRIASYQDVWEAVRTLDTRWLVALGIAVAANVVTYAPPWMIALPGLRFRQAIPFTQASTAFTYIAPGGGLVGMAGSYGLLRTWGFAPNDVARAVTVTGIWNQLANLLLPVIAVMLLGIEGGRDAFLTTVAVVGASVFTVVVGVLTLVLWTDGFARAVGDVAERVAQLLDRGVQALVEADVRLVRPEPLSQLIAAHQTAGVVEEGGQDLERLFLEPNPPAIPSQLVRLEVHFEHSEADRDRVGAQCHGASGIAGSIAPG